MTSQAHRAPHQRQDGRKTDSLARTPQKPTNPPFNQPEVEPSVEDEGAKPHHAPDLAPGDGVRFSAALDELHRPHRNSHYHPSKEQAVENELICSEMVDDERRERGTEQNGHEDCVSVAGVHSQDAVQNWRCREQHGQVVHHLSVVFEADMEHGRADPDCHEAPVRDGAEGAGRGLLS